MPNFSGHFDIFGFLLPAIWSINFALSHGGRVETICNSPTSLKQQVSGLALDTGIHCALGDSALIHSC